MRVLAKETHMPKQALKTHTLTISDVRRRLSSIVEEVSRKETRIVVEKRGIPIAAIVSADDLERLTRIEEEDRRAWAILEAMRAPFRDVSPEEIDREAANAIAEVRAERRAEREREHKAAASA